MPNLRRDFYSAIDAIVSITEEPILLDVLPIGDKHNVTAQILRHGLAVSAFSLLERYIKSVFEEVVDTISRSKLSINDFPEKTQKFLIVDSIPGFSNYLNFIKDSQEKIRFVFNNIKSLHGFNMNPPKYSANGFSPSGSNVNHEDIKKAFQSFLVSDPWGKMDAIARDIGAATLSLENEFRALAHARHRAAHDPAGNIPTATLQAHLQAATTIAITVDLLGCAIGEAFVSCKMKTSLENSVSKARCRFRFLDALPNGGWAERRPDATRIVRKYADRVTGIAGASSRGGSPRVIIRNVRSQPLELA